MSAAAEVAIILFVFFLTGIIVGIIAVIAIPARRPTRRLAARTGQDRPRLRGHITARPVQATMSRPVSAARACRSVLCPFRAARRTSWFASAEVMYGVIGRPVL